MKNAINNYLDRLKICLDRLDRNEIEEFINVMLNARDYKKNIYIIGNGGSAATASHFCCDFNKGMSYGKDKKFRMICLNDNVATMMAYANDISYENIFVEPLQNFMNEGDIVIGISGSGNSQNILRAIEWANSHGGITVGFTGYDGGKLRNIAKYSINTNINDMQITEDVHMAICHMIYNLLVTQKIEDKINLAGVLNA